MLAMLLLAHVPTAAAQTLDEDFSRESDRHDFGLVAGIGIHRQRGRRRWIGEIRYTRGTQRVGSEALGLSARNHSLSALLGVGF